MISLASPPRLARIWDQSPGCLVIPFVGDSLGTYGVFQPRKHMLVQAFSANGRSIPRIVSAGSLGICWLLK